MSAHAASSTRLLGDPGQRCTLDDADGPSEGTHTTGQSDITTAPAGDAPDRRTTRVVLVDARPDRRSVMRQMFEHSDVMATVVAEADDGAGAMRAVEHRAADLVMVDLWAPVQDGLDVVAALRARFPALLILVCSFNGDAAIKGRALADGADAYLPKPVSARKVMATTQGASCGNSRRAAAP